MTELDQKQLGKTLWNIADQSCRVRTADRFLLVPNRFPLWEIGPRCPAASIRVVVSMQTRMRFDAIMLAARLFYRLVLADNMGLCVSVIAGLEVR